MPLPRLDFIDIQHDQPHVPLHYVPLKVRERRTYAWWLTSIESNNGVAERNTLVFSRPNTLRRYLPEAFILQWEKFSSDLKRYKREWGMGSVPTVKRFIRLCNSGNIQPAYTLVTVAYRFGAVPALAIGQVNNTTIALLPDLLERSEGNLRNTDDAVHELLYSYNQYLPQLMQAYFEQIWFYLYAILWEATDHLATTFCLRIRTILAESVRAKLKEIKTSLNRNQYPRSYSLAQELHDRHRDLLKEVEAADILVHLLVNYIYQFFCIKDRVKDYHERLQSINFSQDIMAVDNIGFIKNCARNLLDPEDSFLENLSRERNMRPSWLYQIGRASAFISEVVKFTRDQSRVDIPTVFLTYHFGVKDSELFANQVIPQYDKNKWLLIRGRHLSANIRWSIFSRIWFSEHHVLFLPWSWEKNNGTTKNFGKPENWVIRELLYGQMIGRTLSVVIAAPLNEEVLTQFRNAIANYEDVDFRDPIRHFSTTNTIEQIAQGNWNTSINEAKQRLLKILEQALISCNLRMIDDAFWNRFEKQILYQAGYCMIANLFDVWCHFFDPPTWSIIQAIIRQGEEITIAQLVQNIWELKDTDDCFSWAKKYRTQGRLTQFVRDGLNEKINKFAFSFRDHNGNPFTLNPVKFSDGTGCYHCDVSGIYTSLCTQRGIEPENNHQTAIKDLLLSIRRD